MHAVVIDDDPVTRAMIQGQLDSFGISSDLAGDAEKGMELIRNTRPELCLVDWIMPGIQGTTLVRAIRENASLRETYVIMVTAMSRVEELAVAFHAGVDDFIRKPVHHAELSARLRAATRLIANREELDAKVREVSDLNEQLQVSNARLQQLATTDTMTGIPNRMAALEELDAAWAEWQRYKTPLNVALLDADNFKQINDAYGHAGGDVALRHIATIMATEKRTMDILGRYGGEEFILGLTHQTAEESFEALERLRAAIATTPACIGDEQICVTVSVGLAKLRPETLGFEQLIREADLALYAAKRAGRNRVEGYRPGMTESTPGLQNGVAAA